MVIVPLFRRLARPTLEAIQTQPNQIFLVLFALAYLRYLDSYGHDFLRIDNVDLPTFWSASVAVFRHHVSPYSKATLTAVSSMPVLPFLYPPPALLLFSPMCLLGYQATRVLTLALNQALVVFALCSVAMGVLRCFPRERFPELALTVVYGLLFQPFIVTIKEGQMNLVLLALLVLFWLLARKGRIWSAGFFLALAISLKAYPVVILPMLWVSRRRREIFATAMWMAAIMLVSGLTLPGVVWRDWLVRIVPNGGYGRIPDGLFSPAAPWNQSLNAFFSRLLTESRWSHPSHVHPDLAVALTYLSAAAVTAISLLVVRRAARDPEGDPLDLVMLVSLPLMFLIAPFAWDHHLTYVFPTLMALLTARYRCDGILRFLYTGVAFIVALSIGSPWVMMLKFHSALIAWALLIVMLSRGEFVPLRALRGSRQPL
jgi:alpha-1,2-mannosyltransferase